MKTTLNLDDRLLRAAKRLAADRDVTLTSIVEEALRVALKRPEPKGTSLRWPTVKGRSKPQIDVSDRNALFERMEDRS